MAFIKKLWKDRISQFPNRRTINDGSVTKQVTVGRDEGTITEPGDSFDASNMNDLEQRIEDAYGDVVSLVASEVAAQYDQENVIFDPVATEGHGVGFVVSSDYIANLKAGDLKDVNITTPTPGEALVFDADGNLVNGTVSTVGGLNDLNDVTIDDVTLSDKQELVYDNADAVFKNKTTRVELTQAEYNQLVADDEVLPDVDYYITDAPSMQGTSADLSYDGTTKSVYTKIGEIGTELSGKADKCVKVWSGNKYQANDTMQISDWDNKKFYVIETIGFTGQGWHNFSLVYGGYADWQVGFWGDNTQYCRYRLQVSNTGLVTISDALNSASNTAIVGIYAIG